MRLLSLNIWAASRGQILFDYLKEQAPGTDVFCFQEVTDAPAASPDRHGDARIHLLDELKALLPGFVPYYVPTYKGFSLGKKVEFEMNFGLATFVKAGINVVGSGSDYIFGSYDTKIDENFQNEPKSILRVTCKVKGKLLHVYNVHGMWYPGTKVDSPERLLQSQKILAIMEQQQGAKILCGDFNLNPDTKSFAMIGSVYRDLIRDFKITNTRNKISWDRHNTIQHFADFTFVSSDVEVNSFEVPYNEVSDHLPMILDLKI